METVTAIMTRRSVRKFDSGRKVEPEVLEKILRCAQNAPTAVNSQPWRFVVIEEEDVKRRVLQFHPYASMCLQAPVCVLVCGEPAADKVPGYWVQDCSAAAQNLLLAAHSLGLGAVWTGVHPAADRVEGFRRLLGLPEGIVPLAFVPVGYPAQSPAPQDKFRREKVWRARTDQATGRVVLEEF